MKSTKRLKDVETKTRSGWSGRKIVRNARTVSERTEEALEMLVPTERQKEFLGMDSWVGLGDGPNRCLAGTERIYDPVLAGHRRVDEIDGEFHVISQLPDGSRVVRKAGRPFIKGHGDLQRILLTNGLEFTATLAHRVLTNEGWKSIAEAGGATLIGSGNVDAIQPNGVGDIWDFEVEETHNYVHAGIVHHNSSKTFSNAWDLALMITGRHPNKNRQYPRGYEGRVYVVAKTLNSLSRIWYGKLFKKGDFQVIRDKGTGLLRAFRPHDPDDQERRNEVTQGPPLIPSRMIKEVSFYSVKDRQPKRFVIKNDFDQTWELMFFTAESQPQQGEPIDAGYMTEEFEEPNWFNELIMRTVDRPQAVIRMDATLHLGTDHYLRMIEDAPREQAGGRPRISVVHFSHNDNPYISSDRLKDASFLLTSDTDRDVRIGGGAYGANFKLIYNYGQHVIMPRAALPAGWQHEWTWYAAIDPGINSAAIFAAVPPGNDFILFAREVYLRDKGLESLALAFVEQARGIEIQTVIIDSTYANKRDYQTMQAHRGVLSRHFQQLGFSAISTGTDFEDGDTDSIGRPALIRDAIERRGDGKSYLRILEGACPNLEYEMRTCRRRREKNRRTGEPVWMDEAGDHANDHALDCYDSETEVLANAGWTKFSDLSMTDTVATVNLATDKIEYQHPLRIISKEYSGDVFEFGGLKLNAVVTPNHRMVAYDRFGNTPKIKHAQELTIWDRLKLHTAGWNGSKRDVALVPRVKNGTFVDCEKELNPGDWAELLGWYVAEGCRAKTIRVPGRGYRVSIAQNHSAKRVLLESLLLRTPWRWYSDENGYHASSKQLWEAIGACGDYCYGKCVPDWVRESDQEIIRRFVTGAVLGDGWIQRNRQRECRMYATTSKVLADQMQELYIKLGVSASVARRATAGKPWLIHGRSGTAVHDQFWVSEWIARVGCLRNSSNVPNFKTKPYDGQVYCATVPNGTLIVRRHGKPMVCGNCAGYVLAYRPTWHRPVTFDPAKLIDEQFRRRKAMEDRVMGKQPEPRFSSVHLGPASMSRN